MRRKLEIDYNILVSKAEKRTIFCEKVFFSKVNFVISTEAADFSSVAKWRNLF